MIKQRKNRTKIKGTKFEIESDLTTIFIRLIEDDFMSIEDINKCLKCAESLKELYSGEIKIAPEILGMLE